MLSCIDIHKIFAWRQLISHRRKQILLTALLLTLFLCMLCETCRPIEKAIHASTRFTVTSEREANPGHNDHFDNDIIEPATPNVVHYVFGLSEDFGGKEFGLMHYLSVQVCEELS